MKGILCICILTIKQFDRTYIMHMEFCSLMMTMQQKTQTGKCCWLSLTHAPWRICTSHSLRHGLVCNNKNVKNSRNVLIVWFVFLFFGWLFCPLLQLFNPIGTIARLIQKWAHRVWHQWCLVLFTSSSQTWCDASWWRGRLSLNNNLNSAFIHI